MNLIIPEHLKDKIIAVELPEEGGEGYWIYLKRGWHFKDTDCHTAHEYTLPEIQYAMRPENIVSVEDDWD